MVHGAVHVEKVFAFVQVDEMQVALEKHDGQRRTEQAEIARHLVQLDGAHWLGHKRFGMYLPHFEFFSLDGHTQHRQSAQEQHFGESMLLLLIATILELVIEAKSFIFKISEFFSRYLFFSCG